MIYLFVGDYKTAVEKATKLLEALAKKQPDANVLKINSQNFDDHNLNDLIVSQGLFFNRNLILLSKTLESEESRDLISKNLSQIQESENIFIFVESSLDKKTIEKFKKHSEKIQEIKSAEKKVLPKFNIFGLTDALAKKDKRNLWLLYLEALKKSAAEEIYGILWWQMKTLLIAGKAKNLAESGLKPYVYSKAQNALRNFGGDEEVEIAAFSLVNTYHNSRRQSLDLEIELEKWILSI